MFRFTIRDVLWLIVVVGMALTWWLDCQHKSVTLNEVDLLRMQNNSLRTAVRVTGYDVAETNDGHVFVTRRQDDEPEAVPDEN